MFARHVATLTLAATVFLSCAVAPTKASNSQSTVWLPIVMRPADPVAYWGVLINGVPFDISKLEVLENSLNKKVSIVHWGQPWVINAVYQPFQTAEFNKVRSHGSIPMVNWASWHLGHGINQPDYQLRDIYECKHDNYIRQWASDAKAWGYPLFLRFNHEMNGWWFPWSEQVNGNQPGDFVKAWRHVHDIFAQAGATNVTWVWCPNLTGYYRSTPLEGLYPGDTYVDWIGMDGYNFGTDRNNSWQTFYDVFKHTYDELTTLAPIKPLMIGEVASSEDGGPLGRPASKAAWVSDAFTTQLPTHFPKIKAVVWFNWNDDDPALDWPIESSQASINAFTASIASSYYATNNYANITTSPIPPLRR